MIISVNDNVTPRNYFRLGHDLLSIAEWRSHRGSGASTLHNLLASYFCFGNGGSIVVDLLLTGGPWQLFRSRNVAKYWLLCFLAVNKDPTRILYKSLTCVTTPSMLPPNHSRLLLESQIPLNLTRPARTRFVIAPAISICVRRSGRHI